MADNGIYALKIGYIALIMHKKLEPSPTWWRDIWKLKAPPRTRLFFWCVLKDIIPTGEHLTHRSIYGPSWCSFCKAASETIVHLFLQCSAIRTIWNNISSHIGFSSYYSGDDIIGTWADWNRNHPGSKLLNIPLVVSWHIWLSRNRYIFEGQAVCWPRTEANIISTYQELPDPPPSSTRTIQPPPLLINLLLGPFSMGLQTKLAVGVDLYCI